MPARLAAVLLSLLQLGRRGGAGREQVRVLPLEVAGDVTRSLANCLDEVDGCRVTLRRAILDRVGPAVLLDGSTNPSSIWLFRWALLRPVCPDATGPSSSTITCLPARASSRAVVSPAIPPPTTNTSVASGPTAGSG